jgi:hypothetical protein
VLIVAARLLVPSAPPLYDGVVPLEAYRWLDPPPPGQHGGAKGATAVIPVQGGKSPLVAVATPELQPQAQILAPPEGLALPPGAKTINVSIEPIPAEGIPADGHLDGNVYRFTVTDQDRAPITAPASARVSVVLRAADATASEATIERFVDGTWQPSKTSSEGFGATFLTIATDFGDFAVVAPGPAASVSSSPTLTEPPTESPSAVAITTPGAGPTPPASSTPAADDSGLPAWLLPALGVFAVGVMIIGYRATRHSRPKGW